MSMGKDKRHYTTLYIPASMYESYKQCGDVLDECDCNISQMLMYLIPCIIKVCIAIAALGKNYRHFRFELIAKDYATGNWISSDSDIAIRPKV